MLDHGLDLTVKTDPLGFEYGPDCFGPDPERRRLDDIRQSLRDPGCAGPEVVYAIVMDIGSPARRDDLVVRHLLYGAVVCATGQLGDEPIRSQGHVHRKSPRAGMPTPEVYEFWSGRGFVLMQEHDGDDPGACYAVEAGPGDVVVVPPGWAHATLSATPDQPLAFGAWCDRAYAFDYQSVRAHRGLAWFARLQGGALCWERNPSYAASELIVKLPEPYAQLGLEPGVSIWRQYLSDPGRFDFVPDPARAASHWPVFVP